MWQEIFFLAPDVSCCQSLSKLSRPSINGRLRLSGICVKWKRFDHHDPVTTDWRLFSTFLVRMGGVDNCDRCSVGRLPSSLNDNNFLLTKPFTLTFSISLYFSLISISSFILLIHSFSSSWMYLFFWGFFFLNIRLFLSFYFSFLHLFITLHITFIFFNYISLFVFFFVSPTLLV